MQQINMDQSEVDDFSQITPNHKFSGFGIILDTTRGIRVKNPSTVEYSTQIKLIDMTFNPSLGASAGYSKNYITFFVYWTNNDQQPFCFKIGDIMRFTHFDFEKYKDYLQGKNKKGASWCIFHGDNNTSEPYCHSGEFKEKITQFHVEKLYELRQWTTNFFQQHSLRELDWYSYERHIENPNVVQSFDMLLRVEAIRFPPDETSDIFLVLLDERQARFRAHASMTHARFLKEGDVVKLRSIERIEGDYLKGHSRYFAVLGIPTNFKDYRDFVLVSQAIEIPATATQSSNIRLTDTQMEEEIEEPTTEAGLYRNFDAEFFKKGGVLLENGSLLSSDVSLRRKDIPKKTGFEVLRELEVLELESNAEKNRYHIRATLIDIRPKSLFQCLRNECRTCGLLRKLDAVEGETCCQRKMDKTMLLRLVWQDQSLKGAKKLLITYVTPGEGDFVRNPFPDFPLQDVKTGQLESEEQLWDEITEKYLEDDRLFDILVETYYNPKLSEKDGQPPLRLTETLFVSVKPPTESTTQQISME